MRLLTNGNVSSILFMWVNCFLSVKHDDVISETSKRHKDQPEMDKRNLS